MMIKYRLKVLSICLLIIFSFIASIKVVGISAIPDDEIEETGKDTEQTNVSLKTSNFYTEAIKSIDPAIRENEDNQDYIKNFSNSGVTALSYDLSLIDPDTIIMHAIGLIINIIESIGSLCSLIVLIAYNLASSSFWKITIDNIFNIFDQAFFNWSDPNSYFYKIVILFGLIAIIKKILSSMKRIVTYKVFISIIFQVVLSCMLIVFIAQQGRNVVNYVDNLVNNSIAVSFNFLDDQYEEQNIPLEINVKNQIFDIMQKQSFVLRHFGVTSADKIPNEYKNTYKGQDWVVKESGEKRLQTLLNNPSTENARIERQEYGNDQIGYSGAQCGVILGESIVFLVHRFLMGFVIASACIILFGFCFLKEVSLGLSIYGLVFMLFKNELRIASSWFMSRLKWTIMFVFINLAFNMFLSFMIIMINAIASQALLFLLIFDIVIAALIVYLIKNWHTIWEKITKDLGIEADSTIIDAGKAILNGDINPRDIYSNHKERIAEERRRRNLDNYNDQENDFSSVSNIKSGDDLADQDEVIESDERFNKDENENTDDEFDIDKEFEENPKDAKEDIGITNKMTDEENTVSGVSNNLDESLNSDIEFEEQKSSINTIVEDIGENLNDNLYFDENEDMEIKTSIEAEKNDLNNINKSLKDSYTLNQEETKNDIVDLNKVNDSNNIANVEEINTKMPITDEQKEDLDEFIDEILKEDDSYEGI